MGFFTEAIKVAIIVAAIGIAARFTTDVLLYLDLNKRVYNHVPGPCSAVTGLERGAADMEYVPSMDVVLVTSGLRHYSNVSYDKHGKKIRPKQVDAYRRGTTYSYNVSGSVSWEIVIDSDTMSNEQFNPFGISVHDGKKKVCVMIVNMRQHDHSTVEVFDYKSTVKDKILKHIKTIRRKEFGVLRDVAALDNVRFYATRFFSYNRHYARMAERFMGLRTGAILYYDGRSVYEVWSKLSSPAGILLDRTKKFLYVTSTTEGTLTVFKVQPDRNLTLHTVLELKTGVDQITKDAVFGDLYVAAHPQKSRMFYHELHPYTSQCPSQVLKLSPKSSAQKSFRISQVYANDGASLSGSSVALRYGETIIIGSLHHRLITCELQAPQLL